MICTSIAEPKLENCFRYMRGERMVEIRLDYLQAGNEEIESIFKQQLTLVATCRTGTLTDDQRKEKLTIAIESGANYVDIEYESDELYRAALIEKARKSNTKVIISYHNFEITPSTEELKRIVDCSFAFGADIVKIATMAKNNRDNARIMSLYNDEREIIAFGMGDKGQYTRIIAHLMGAPFVYAAKTREHTIAPGQISKINMEEILEKFHDL